MMLYPAWEQRAWCGASPCLSFPHSIGIALGRVPWVHPCAGTWRCHCTCAWAPRRAVWGHQVLVQQDGTLPHAYLHLILSSWILWLGLSQSGFPLFFPHFTASDGALGLSSFLAAGPLLPLAFTPRTPNPLLSGCLGDTPLPQTPLRPKQKRKKDKKKLTRLLLSPQTELVGAERGDGRAPRGFGAP